MIRLAAGYLRYFLLTLAAVLFLAACGGGGGGVSATTGGNSGGGGAAPPPFTLLSDSSGTTLTAAVLRAANAVTAAATTFRTAEYSRQYGMDKMGAAEGYSRGYYGQGVTVAVVDSGFTITHSDLSGQFVAGTNTAGGTDVSSGRSGHGSHVAGIIAAKMDGSGMQGVAPQAKLLPIKMNISSAREESIGAISYALARNAKIINNSWNMGQLWVAGVYQRAVTLEVYLPLSAEVLSGMKGGRATITVGTVTYQNPYNNVSLWSYQMVTATQDKDSVLVWAAGNSGFNSEFWKGFYTNKGDYDYRSDFLTHFMARDYPHLVASLRLASSTNGANYYAAAPFFEPRLIGKWVAVVATDNDNRLWKDSNGCGASKYWCIAAPGVNITSVSHRSGVGHVEGSGTSMAAPHVSGALAVLKSRFPNMPMRAILFILFKTATDLGAPGVDDVYGHGLVNLARALTVQGHVNLITDDGAPPAVAITSSFTLLRDGSRVTAVALGGSRVTSAASFYTFRTAEYNRQYGLKKIGAAHAYSRGYYGQNVTVAVIDSGLRTTHNDLSGQFVGATNVVTGGIVVTDTNGHGTHVAGIIAAKMNGSGMHGVAPHAKVMPIHALNARGRFENTSVAIRYALDRNVQVINNSWGPAPFCDSWGGTYQVTTAVSRVCIPATAELLHAIKDDTRYGGRTAYNRYRNWSRDMATRARGKDTVLVWAAGNDHYNSVNGDVLLNLVSGSTLTVRTTAFVAGYTGTLGAASTLKANGADAYNLAPLFDASLIGKWVAVVATDSSRSNTIAPFSNGCGAAKYWCIAAPGVDITSADFRSDTRTTVISGTSMAAPHVSGALAVLKSRFPTMPMSVVLFILFKTATDLGEAGVDDVYGHGLVNLEKASFIQGDINLITDLSEDAGTFRGARLRTSESGDKPRSTSSVSDNSTRVLLKDSRMALPALLGHLKPRLDKVSVGANMLGVYYYNTPVGGLVTQKEGRLPSLGNGAAELLSPRREMLREPGNPLFFVRDNAAGRIVSASWQSPYLRLRWQVCARCTPSVWQSTGDSRPFYADSQQALEAAFRFGKKWELFMSSGFGRRWSDKDYDQVGVRFQHVGAGWGVRSAFSLAREDDSFLGGDYEGGFAVAGSDTYQGRIRLHKALAAGWQGYVDYRGGEINGHVAGHGSMIKALSAVRFSDWRIGLTGQGVWRPDDVLHLSLQQRGVLHSGDMQLRYGVASGRAVEDADTKMSFQRGYEVVNRSLPLASSGITQLRIGYALQPAENTRLAVAVERELGGETALSAQLRWSF